MTEILSAEEVARWLANVDYEYPGAADALAEHDDALRRRLAEVEAERDQLGVLYRKADAGRRTESRRLAEVEQALRKYGEHRIGCSRPGGGAAVAARATAVSTPFSTRGSSPMADYPNARDCEHGRLRRSCEQCSDAFLIAALEARLAEVEGALRSVAQHPCYDVREWAGEVVPCGYCPSCIARAVLDKGKPDGR